MRPLLFFRLLLSALFAAIVFGNGIDDLAPVEITVIERANQNLCSCDISGNGDVMNVAKAQKVALHLAVIGIGRGIAEEEQKIDLVVRNAGCYLLRSAVFTEEESPTEESEEDVVFAVGPQATVAPISPAKSNAINLFKCFFICFASF